MERGEFAKLRGEPVRNKANGEVVGYYVLPIWPSDGERDFNIEPFFDRLHPYKTPGHISLSENPDIEIGSSLSGEAELLHRQLQAQSRYPDVHFARPARTLSEWVASLLCESEQSTQVKRALSVFARQKVNSVEEVRLIERPKALLTWGFTAHAAQRFKWALDVRVGF